MPLLLSLFGCPYISAEEHAERFAHQEVALVLESIEPSTIGGCETPELTIAGHVDGWLAGQPMEATIDFRDNGTFALSAGTVTPVAAADGFADVTIPFTPPLLPCPVGSCEHTVRVGLSGVASGVSENAVGVTVVAEQPPWVSDLKLFAADGSFQPYDDVPLGTDPPDSLSTASWTRLALGIRHPLLDRRGPEGFSIALVGCPMSVDPLVDPDACITVPLAYDATLALSGSPFIGPLAPLTEDGCASEPSRLFAAITGPCTDERIVIDGPIRIVGPEGC
jgi:hypothetical protein